MSLKRILAGLIALYNKIHQVHNLLSGKLDVALSTRASETTLAGIKTQTDKLLFDTESRLIVNLGAEQVGLASRLDTINSTLQQELTRIAKLKGYTGTDWVDLLATSEGYLRTSLASDEVGLAKEATLQGIKSQVDKLTFDTSNYLYTRLGAEDVGLAKESTLQGIKAQVDKLQFDANNNLKIDIATEQIGLINRLDTEISIIDEQKYIIDDFTRRRIGGQVLFLIDFTRPYDSEYFKQFISPAEAYQGVVDYSAEGLPDPGTGSRYLAKLKVDAGASVKVIIPIQVPIRPVIAVIRLWVPTGVRVDFAFEPSPDWYKTEKWETKWYGVNGYAEIVLPNGGNNSRLQFINLKFTNETSETKYVYVAVIAVFCVIEPTRFINLFKISNLELTVSAETKRIVQELFLGKWLKVGSIFVHVTLAGDGTNPCTVEVRIVSGGEKTIGSISRTSTDYALYMVSFRVFRVLGVYSSDIIYVISSDGTGKVKHLDVELITFPDSFKSIPSRLAGSYTSDGDGSDDVVTLIDYETAQYHIKKLKVYASGDTNTKKLVLRIDGQDCWDFLNDGDTVEFDFHDGVRKVQLVVNDPGGGTTTTVNYKVWFEKRLGHLWTGG